MSLTDVGVLCPAGGRCDKEARTYLGAIDGLEAVRAMRAYTTAFFDQHLKGEQQKLLDGPSFRYPEVEFLP